MGLMAEPLWPPSVLDPERIEPGLIRDFGPWMTGEQRRIYSLCQRFLQEPYARHLPRDWFNESPLELIARDPAAEVRKFFGKAAPIFSELREKSPKW